MPWLTWGTVGHGTQECYEGERPRGALVTAILAAELDCAAVRNGIHRTT